MRSSAPLPLLLLLATACLHGGCGMQRTLRIDSDPSGARAWVDGKERGLTPIRVPYVHPGAFHVRLEKAGYASLAEDVRIPSTIDDYPVVDLPREILGGSKQVVRTLRLERLPPEPTPAQMEAVRDRAAGFRERAHREVTEPGTPQPRGR